MKKYLLILPLLLLAACAQTMHAGNRPMCPMMDGGCSHCQKMMQQGDSGMMKDGKMQCPMMDKASKDGMTCCCCQEMMKDGQKKPVQCAPAKKASDADHVRHHPVK